MTSFFYFLISRAKLLLVFGFVSYGVLSVLAFPLGFPLILHGGPETYLFFASTIHVLMGGRMESVTEFIGYTGIIVGFVGTGVVWALFAIFIHNILSWLDEDKHVFERFKRK